MIKLRRWACSIHGVKGNAYRILLGKPEGKRPLCRPRCRWEDNIKMGQRNTGWGGMGSIHLLRIATSGELL
jgi:hypothetical protein